jgi:hypothetical protein
MNIYKLLAKRVSFPCSDYEITLLMGAIKMQAAKMDTERPKVSELTVFATYMKAYRYLSNRLDSLYIQGKNSGTLSFLLPDLLILHDYLPDYNVPELRLVMGKINKIAVNHSHLVELTQSQSVFQTQL